MTYAYSTDQTTIEKRHRELPAEHWVQDAPYIGHFEALTVGNAASFGYYLIDVSGDVRPADTPTTTHDRTLPFVIDKFVATWTERAKTQAELDADADELERQQARDAHATLTDYLGLPSPSTAQTVAAVDLLARVAKRLIRDNYGE